MSYLFKKGDRVMLKTNCYKHYGGPQICDQGTVTEDNSGIPYVRFDYNGERFAVRQEYLEKVQ
jgi:hypothetical protein